ncbi:MAG: hypothetical protein M1817_002381 [Caeruleum heppii]|nr:MAG: hypothetical protein M1817_002381 [Caeruleum heppii]
MSSSTEFISFLPPPGPSVLSYTRASSRPTSPGSTHPHVIPSTFLDAMSVRETVYVKEQKIPFEDELDADDVRSFHWVVYASVSSSSSNSTTTAKVNHSSSSSPSTNSKGRKGSETAALAVGTIRLVPPPHPPHPTPGSEHKIDNAEAQPPVKAEATPSKWHDGVEPYIKLGRLASLSAYRGLGLGRLLVNAALEWASKNADAIVPPQSPTSLEAAKVEHGGGGGGGHLDGEARRWKGLVLVHAQKQVEPVWRKLGFERDDGMGVWDENGIEHVGMWRRVPVQEGRSRSSSRA